jgi:hypothetical protein
MALDLEDMIVEYLRPRLSDEEKRCLETRPQIGDHIDEDSLNEMREQLFMIVWSRISAGRIIQALMRDVDDEVAEEPPSSEDEEED